MKRFTTGLLFMSLSFAPSGSRERLIGAPESAGRHSLESRPSPLARRRLDSRQRSLRIGTKVYKPPADLDLWNTCCCTAAGMEVCDPVAATAVIESHGLHGAGNVSNLVPHSHLLGAFAVASLVLAVTPGPGVAYIVARSAVQGRRIGLVSVAGVALGNWGNSIAAAVGLAALFLAFAPAFHAVKWAGAGYLIYLGVKTVRGSPADAAQEPIQPVPAMTIFRDGFIVAFFNPKTALFFAAFLPQFMTTKASPLLQGVLLGSLFVTIAALTDSLYAIAASRFSKKIERSAVARRGGRLASGGVLIGLGLFAAIGGSKNPG